MGNYITSLEMAGCSITLLKADDELLSLWDDPVLTAGAALGDLSRWPWASRKCWRGWKRLQQVYAENRQWLTELDSAIGDADHGINMDRGFTAVKAELAAQAPPDIRSVFQNVATALIRNVGGAAGPLYGTFFLRAAAACAGKTEIDAADVVAMFQAGIEGVRQRGKAAAGDKTMLDALLPALDAMRKALEDGSEPGGRSWTRARRRPKRGCWRPIPMQARKGRASYLGARSIGHQDPGATSSYLLLKAAADTWRS